MKFSLVIPCYNEEKNLPFLLERGENLQHDDGVEGILVNNGSTDQTALVMKQLLPKYPNCRCVNVEKNQGYGFGILAGLEAAKGSILGWTHADMQTDPKDVSEGLKLFVEYGDKIFVKGTRRGRPFLDLFFTVGMSVFETCLLRKRLWDINAQPTMFSRSFFEQWKKPPYDFSLDLYAYFQARRKELSIKRFPVHFGKRLHGSSHWNINWTSKYKFIKRTLEFSFQLMKSMEV